MATARGTHPPHARVRDDARKPILARMTSGTELRSLPTIALEVGEGEVTRGYGANGVPESGLRSERLLHALCNGYRFLDGEVAWDLSSVDGSCRREGSRINVLLPQHRRSVAHSRKGHECEKQRFFVMVVSSDRRKEILPCPSIAP